MGANTAGFSAMRCGGALMCEGATGATPSTGWPDAGGYVPVCCAAGCLWVALAKPGTSAGRPGLQHIEMLTLTT